jgi:hypothetical protein
VRVPDQQRRRALCLVEDQEQVDKMLEIRESARSWPTSSSTTRAACATTTKGLASLDELIGRRQGVCHKQHPAFFRKRSRRPAR